MLTPASRRAASTTGTMARRCSREASSGTTPPYGEWMAICEATTFESGFGAALDHGGGGLVAGAFDT